MPRAGFYGSLCFIKDVNRIIPIHPARHFFTPKERIGLMEKHIKIYRDATGLSWPGSLYHIHHLDGNHKNNDIDNLLLIPKDLHHRYHFYKNNLPETFPTKPVAISNCPITHWVDNVRGYAQALEEMQMWMDYKNYCLGILPNIHGLTITEA